MVVRRSTGGVDNGIRVIGDRLSFQTMDGVVRIAADRAISVRDTCALTCAIELIAKGIKHGAIIGRGYRKRW